MECKTLENPPVGIETVTPRQAEALNYRRRGYTWRQIGPMMGVAPVTAYKHAQAAIRGIAAYDKFQADEVRRIELDRLDAGVRCVMEIIGEPDDANKRPDRIRLQAVDRLIHLSERRSKLLGLDEAAKLAPDDRPTDIDELHQHIRDRVRAIKQAQKGQATQPSEN